MEKMLEIDLYAETLADIHVNMYNYFSTMPIRVCFTSFVLIRIVLHPLDSKSHCRIL